MTARGGATAAGAKRPAPLRSRVPTLRHERRLLREGHLLVAGMDEVGRGALAGPVSVGVVVVDATVRTAPSGVRDSKLLTPTARVALVPRLRRWAVSWAVGHASAEEIDRYGIIAALRLAGRRALATLPVAPTCVLLDGKHDWLSPPRPRPSPRRVEPPPGEALFDLPPTVEVIPAPVPPLREPAPPVALTCEPSVLTLIKADLRCAAVAAASVLAKVERDALMVDLAERFPRYNWHENKGYSAPDHVAALTTEGPCQLHRRSWNLPGVGDDPALIDLSGLEASLEGEGLDDLDELAAATDEDGFDDGFDDEDEGLGSPDGGEPTVGGMLDGAVEHAGR